MDRVLQESDCEPDIVTWNTLLGVFGKNNMYEEVLKVFIHVPCSIVGPVLINWETFVYLDKDYVHEHMIFFSTVKRKKIETL